MQVVSFYMVRLLRMLVNKLFLSNVINILYPRVPKEYGFVEKELNVIWLL